METHMANPMHTAASTTGGARRRYNRFAMKITTNAKSVQPPTASLRYLNRRGRSSSTARGSSSPGRIRSAAARRSPESHILKPDSPPLGSVQLHSTGNTFALKFGAVIFTPSSLIQDASLAPC